MKGETNENYRKAAVMLAKAVREDGVDAVMFTAAQAGAGTTTAVLNVARFLSTTCGLKPLVVELDLDRPVLAGLLGLDPSRSLQAVCAQGQRPTESAQSCDSGVAVIPAAGRDAGGALNADLPSLLKRIIQDAKGSFDLVLIDAPPVLHRADALAALAAVPRVVLVVEAGRTREEMLDRVRLELDHAHAVILGAILNKHRRFIPVWAYRLFIR